MQPIGLKANLASSHSPEVAACATISPSVIPVSLSLSMVSEAVRVAKEKMRYLNFLVRPLQPETL